MPIFLFLALVALASWHPVVDHDIGFNLAAGRTIVSGGEIPEVDHLSVAGEGKPWINRLWGFQVVLYFFYKHFQFHGISLFTALFAMGAFAFLVLSVPDKENRPWILIFSLVLFLVQVRLRARPEIVSFFFLATVYYLLERFQKEEGPASRTIFFIPFIQLIWANSHGLFILGIVLQILLLVSWLLERPVSRYLHLQTCRNSSDKIGVLAFVIGLSCAVCLINPFGLQGFLVPFQQYRMLAPDNFFLNITELIPTHRMLLDYWTGNKWFLIVLVSFSLLAASPFIRPRKGIRLYHLLIFLSFFYLALKANRNLSLFALVTAPVACHPFAFKENVEKKQFFFTQQMPMLLVSALIFIRLALPFHFPFFLYPLGSGVHPKEAFAFRPIEFLMKNKLPGPVFPTDLRDGNLLSWKGIKPVYDGRLEVFGEEFFRRYHKETILSEEKFLDEAEKYKVYAVLVRHRFDNRYPAIAQSIPQRAHDLYKNPNWSLVYFDSSFLIFIRNHAANEAVIEKFGFDFQKEGILERILDPAGFYHPGDRDEYLGELGRVVRMLAALQANHLAERITSVARKVYTQE